jgi:hypothetical protein
MDIGKPKRIYRVEPLVDPVPQQAPPEKQPDLVPQKNEPVPAA